jgi:hypothetical protein
MYGTGARAGIKGRRGAVSLFFKPFDVCLAYSFSILLDRNKENGEKGKGQCVLVCVLSLLRVNR